MSGIGNSNIIVEVAKKTKTIENKGLTIILEMSGPRNVQNIVIYKLQGKKIQH